MKLRIGSKNEYDKWFQSYGQRERTNRHRDSIFLDDDPQSETILYTEDETMWTNVPQLLLSHPPLDIHIVDTPNNVTVASLIQQLVDNNILPSISESRQRQYSNIPVNRPIYQYSRMFQVNIPPSVSEVRKSSSELVTEYYLYCLSACPEPLDPERQLSSYQIYENDILLLGMYTRVALDPVAYRARAYRDLTDFARIVRERKDFERSSGFLYKLPPTPVGRTDSYLDSWAHSMRYTALRPIEGVLLYTDEDEEIARYIRFYFSSLDAMTGHHLNIYVLENPGEVEGASSRAYWKARLDERLYSILSLVGWTRTKPYAKRATYEIAEFLGLYSDALPCLTIFGDITSDEKIVLSIGDDMPGFFRAVCSIVKKTMEELRSQRKTIIHEVWGESPVWPGFELFKSLFMNHWKEIEKSVLQRDPQSAFTFNGNTVFIHRPQGKIELSDFQKGVRQ